MGKSKKVLKAPHKITAPVGSSQGTVEFVDGVATEFTQAQADHYLKNFNGYELIDVEDDPPVKEKTDLAKLVAGLGEGNDEPDEEKEESVEDIESEEVVDDSKKGDEVSVDKAATDKVDEPIEDESGDDKPEDEDEPDEENDEKTDIEDEMQVFPEIVPSEKDHVNEIRTFITEYSVVKDGARRKADMLKAIRRDSRFKE